MAVINSKKLLPPSKSSGSALSKQKFLVPISNIKPKSSAIIKASDISLSKTDRSQSQNALANITKKFIDVEKIISANVKVLEKSEERKRKLLEQKSFSKQEEKIEAKKQKAPSNINVPSLPRTGFLDAIRRFLLYTFLGYAFNKFGKYIPKVLKLTQKLIPVYKFFESFTGNLLNGAVSFIDIGYKTYDKVKELSKTVGGENAEKKFNEFSKQFNTFANLAIIAGMSTMGGTDFGKKGKAGNTTINTGQKNARLKSASGERNLSGSFTPKGYLPGDKITQYGPKNKNFLQKAGQQARILGKRTFGKFAGKVFGKIPIIGGLIDFIVSTVIFKENPGRAAAKAVGSTIGAALGTFIPVPFAGTILGGILGDLVGGALYDTLVGPDSIMGKSQGGEVTRGGKRVNRPAKRRIQRIKTRPPKIKPQKTIPGKDIGGKKEIEKLFPSSNDPKIRNPLGILESTSTSLKQVPMIGGLMGASLDLVMGQKPDANVFKRIGNGFGSLIQSAIDSETSNTISNIQKEIVGLANGGIIPRTLSTEQNIGMKIGERIAKTLEVMMNVKVSETLQAIRQQFGKEGLELTGGDGGTGGGQGGAGGGGGGGGGGMFTGKASDIPPEGKALLDAIAGSESGGYNSRYPSKTFDNGWIDHPRISERIRSGPNAGKTSDAAGRYQFLSTTWDQYKPAKAFTPENQDIAAYRLAIAAYGYGEQGLIRDLKKDPLKVANKLSRTWTSLPGGIEPNNATNGFLARYKQKVKKYENQNPSLTTKGVKKFSRSDITSLFRQQESFRSKPHEGMDIAAPQGTPISFGMGGEILGVWRTSSGDRNANGGYGTYMDVKFSDGRIARIAHLSDVPLKLRKGSTFKANQIIAYSGGQEGAPGSGRSGGPHIHLEQLSKPMGSEETTRGKFDPLKGGLFDLIQKGGTRASIAPSTSTNMASGLNQRTSYEIAGGSTIMMQRVIVEKPVPVNTGSTGFVPLPSIDSTNILAPLSVG
jgi:muramidase (phage lysozyme)